MEVVVYWCWSDNAFHPQTLQTLTIARGVQLSAAAVLGFARKSRRRRARPLHIINTASLEATALFASRAEIALQSKMSGDGTSIS